MNRVYVVSESLRRLVPRQAATRLFCFPYAGAGATAFRKWHADIDAGVEVVSVQLPGREERIAEPLATDLTATARAIAGEMVPLIDRPYGMYGHSLGALLAFETARELDRLGAPAPRLLVVAAHRAPHVPRATESWHDLPEPELIDRMRRLGGTAEAVLQHPELMEVFLPIMRADLAIVENYRFKPGPASPGSALLRPALRCPVLAVGGLDDAEVSRDALAAWAEQTSGAFDLVLVPGHHLFTQQPAALEDLWPRIVRALAG